MSLPENRIADQTWFEAVNLTDAEDRFRISAETELMAKKLLLEKIGYYVHKVDGLFVLYDADSDEPQSHVPADTVEEAIDTVLRVARWSVREPTLLIGGITNMNEDTENG